MRNMNWILIAVIVFATGIATACSSEECDDAPVNSYDETFTQISTIDAILEGVYDGVMIDWSGNIMLTNGLFQQ